MSVQEELQKAKDELAKGERLQELMKSANAAIRSGKDVEKKLSELKFSEQQIKNLLTKDYAGRVGFPQYRLTNNNQNNKRLIQRIAQLERKAGALKTEKQESYDFEGGKIEVNYPVDRVQIFFDSIPDSEKRSKLKSNGWKWSPTNKAWQRKITPQAISNAVYLTGAKASEENTPEQKIKSRTFTMDDIAGRNFSYVSMNGYNAMGSAKEYADVLFSTLSGKLYAQLVVFSPDPKVVRENVQEYMKEHFPKMDISKLVINIYPQKYVSKVKGLLNSGLYLPSSSGPEKIMPTMYKAYQHILQLKRGTAIEQEHKETLEKVAAGKISVEKAIEETAEEHIKEDPEYYEKLENIKKRTKAEDIGNEAISFFTENDLIGYTAHITNNNHTIRFEWKDKAMELIIDAGSPVADGIYVKRENESKNFKLSEKQESFKYAKVLFKKEISETSPSGKIGNWSDAQVNQYASRFGWTAYITGPFTFSLKNRAGKIPAMVIIDENDGEKYKIVDTSGRILLSGRGQLEESLSKVLKEYFYAKENVEKEEYFRGFSHTYDNQYLLNKAIEQYITEKGADPNSYNSDEKMFIRKYSGYGGLDKYGKTGKGGLFEYYTPVEVIKKMWALAYKYGYNNGPMLEPAVGTGEFLQFAKPEIRSLAFEISEFSAKICKILYPTTEVLHQPFEQHFIRNNYTVKDKLGEYEKFDLVIGNPPYGDFSIVASRYMTGMGEKDHTQAKNYVEYFIRRGVDLLKPKGLLIFIVGAEVRNGGILFLDGGNTPVKEYLSQNCEFLDAYRLPDTIFERTGVTSEIIVLKKI